MPPTKSASILVFASREAALRAAESADPKLIEHVAIREKDGAWQLLLTHKPRP